MHCREEHAAARASVWGFPLDGTPAWPLHSCKLQGWLHDAQLDKLHAAVTPLPIVRRACSQLFECLCHFMPLRAGRKSGTDDDSDEWEEDGASDEEANGAIAKLEAELGIPGGLGLGQGGCTD